MSKVDVLLGLQWGDEGKGKIVDVLTPDYDAIARFQGGPNAGHTLVFNDIKHVLHIIPSGIFREDSINVIGNGVVIDPLVLEQELSDLEQHEKNARDKLYVSKKAHLTLPTHRLLDGAQEKNKGKSAIGSTLKGIGPTYVDKTGRTGLRVGDVLSPNFEQKYKTMVEGHLRQLKFYGYDTSGLKQMEVDWFIAIETLKSLHLIDSEHFINKMLADGKRILAEGAQGSLLDIEFGSYPFVTSSNTLASGACSGLGIAPAKIKNVYGVFKAYCTRVGSGPFPTELFDEIGASIQKIGGEVGATTGRTRRCGWLDLPALKYTCMLNGVTELFMMKGDVLSRFETLKICTGYKLNDRVIDHLPYDMTDQDLEPIYEELEGWSEDVTHMTSYEQLPTALKKYVEFIETELHVPITLISVGPNRTQTIKREAM